MTVDVFARNHVHVVGDGPQMLVLAHGFGSDQTAWRHQVEALKGRYRIVLYDHVGAGHSDLSAYSPTRYRSYAGYTQDLLEVLHAAGAGSQRVHFVGHSMSAMVGLLAAIEQPERFGKLVFIGASPRYLDDPDSGYRGGFTQADIDGLIEAMSGNYHAWASGFAGPVVNNPDCPDVVGEFAGTLQHIRPDIAVAVTRMVYASDHRSDLPALHAPVLVVQSTDDIAVPMQVGGYLQAQLPDAQLKVLPARGHLPHLTAPGAVLTAINEFLC